MRRGFTLVELLAVIAMVGIIAAASAPSIIYYLRDRRINDAGSEIANLYRYARARAMGRGSAVNVRYNETPDALNALDGTDPNARFAVREAVMAGLPASVAATGHSVVGDAAQQRLGVPNCRNTNWGAGVPGTLYLGHVDDRRSRFYPAYATFRWYNDSVVSGTVDICFTPRGRVWIDNNGGGFNAIAGVPYVLLENLIQMQPPFGDVSNVYRRKVIIPPSGAARLITEI
jgi:type IV fimbrial biogenesis protein FimT